VAVKPAIVRHGDSSSKWKVPHWKSMNTTAFSGSNPTPILAAVGKENTEVNA
jgi:hypothetical protein